MWAMIPIVPAAVKAAKAREWPTVPTSRGAHQQPMKKPKKCAEPRSPISALENPSATPESASSGATPPVPSWRKMIERKRAAKERRRRIGPGFFSGHHVARARVCPEPIAARGRFPRGFAAAGRVRRSPVPSAGAEDVEEDPEPHGIADAPGMARCAEGRAADRAGDQDRQIVAHARVAARR